MGFSLLPIINEVRINKGLAAVTEVTPAQRLREDLGFDSFDLAELTVRIEQATGVDVFAAGLVTTVGEVMARVEGGARDGR